MTSKDNKNRRNNKCHGDPELLDVGAELNGVKSIHNDDRSTAEEGEMQKLNSALLQELVGSFPIAVYSSP